MIMKVTNSKWMSMNNIQRASTSIGGLHKNGKLTIEFKFESKNDDTASFKLDLIPNTVILDRFGTDYTMLDVNEAVEILRDCEMEWLPELVRGYIELIEEEDSGMNLPSFKSWVKDKMQNEIKDKVDKTIDEYLTMLGILIKRSKPEKNKN